MHELELHWGLLPSPALSDQRVGCVLGSCPASIVDGASLAPAPVLARDDDEDDDDDEDYFDDDDYDDDEDYDEDLLDEDEDTLEDDEDFDDEDEDL